MLGLREFLTRLGLAPDQWSWPVALFLVGLALLGVFLIVLRTTRWGQAKTLSKCVALSVFAHLLLLIYAWSINLFFGAPPKERERILHLSLVSPDDSVPASDTAANPAGAPPDVPSARPNPQPAAPAKESRPEGRPSSPPAAPASRPRPEVPPATEQRPKAMPAPAPPRPADAPNGLDPARQDAVAPRLAETAMPTPKPEALAAETDQPSSPPPTFVVPVRPLSPPPERGIPATMAAARPPRPDRALAARRPADGEPIPEILRGRQQRAEMVAQHGGTPRGESSVKAALDWLAANQERTGRWDSRRFGAGQETKTLGHDRGGAGAQADTGISALALLAFSGAGDTHLDGPYQPTVQRGLEFLMRSQAADGNLYGEAELFARMYCHGMATLALSEAYALSGDARLRPAVERALQYTVRAQHPVDGGWRYQPGDPGDMSQFGWQVLALKSAELAGLPIPAETRAGMIRFLNLVAAGPHRGLASYRPRQAPSRTMTAEALTCRLLLQLPVTPEARQEAVAYLLEEPPDAGPVNLYYWYYATLGLFQFQDEAWKTWNRALQQRLLESQETRGAVAGSWSPDAVWGGYGGRVYSTALAALCLEVYYRYLPLAAPGR